VQDLCPFLFRAFKMLMKMPASLLLSLPSVFSPLPSSVCECVPTRVYPLRGVERRAFLYPHTSNDSYEHMHPRHVRYHEYAFDWWIQYIKRESLEKPGMGDVGGLSVKLLYSPTKHQAIPPPHAPDLSHVSRTWCRHFRDKACGVDRRPHVFH
jgi:hypothetical protein